MKRIIKMLSLNKIRRKLILYFMVTTLLMGIGCLFTYYTARLLASGMDAIFTNNEYLTEISNNVTSVHSTLETFLSTNHSESLKEYYRSSSNLRTTGEDIRSKSNATDSGLMLQDIGNMIITYLDSSDAAVNAKRGRDIEGYIDHYTEASQVYDYITQYINKLTLNQFDENTKGYTLISGRLNFILLANLLIILGIIAFNIIFILRMTFKTTQPIISLAKAANDISKGEYDIEQVSVHSDDEIGIMADAFNRMAESIKNQVTALKETAELEARLKEQKMQNLIMKSHLKETELQALQSQINPHFIFNTLNAGAQLAMFEEADRTYLYIECFSNLFRYNLRRLDTPVTLREEIDNINNYIALLKVRFADRINFRQEVDENVVDVLMPCLVLQPLIENAFIHGISGLESGGTITLRVKGMEDAIIIEIEDDGIGMSREKIKNILEEKEPSQAERESGAMGHTTGIGTRNVMQRLKNFFNSDDVFDIYSRQPGGTRIIIKIQKNLAQREKESLDA